MAKTEIFTLKLTVGEYVALQRLVDSASSMIGGGDPESDREFKRGVDAFDRASKRSNLPERKFK